MYEQKDRSPFLVHDDGTNSPFGHQVILSKLTVELGVLYFHKKTINLIPLPETPLDEGPGFPVPDVILYDQEAEQTRIIIEVCSNRGIKNDLKKVIRLIEEDDYGILEGFVYNYKTRAWLRYRKGDGGIAIASSYSELMGVEMGGMV
jgi:Uma2 family endonuclease